MFELVDTVGTWCYTFVFLTISYLGVLPDGDFSAT